MHKKDFKIVLFAPEIPGNTGTIGRTCVALDIELIIIKPCAFDLSEKAVRRAGLDYWKYVKLSVYDDFQTFVNDRNIQNNQLHFLSRFAKKSYYEAQFQEGDYIVFGSETKGLPDFIHENYKERLLIIPTFGEHIRSLNLANAATAVAFEAVRQIEFKN